MNSRHRTALAKAFAEPTVADLRWSDIKALFKALGAEIGEGSGSRVRVALGGVRAVFHRPHPSPDAKRSTVRAVRDFLTAARVQPGKDQWHA